MTNFIKTSSQFAILTLTLSVTAAPTLVTAQNHSAAAHGKIIMQPVAPMSPAFQATGQPGQTGSATPDPFCENVFVFFEEDADGNRVPGTTEYGCDDD